MLDDSSSAKRRHRAFSPAQILLPEDQKLLLDSVDIHSGNSKYNLDRKNQPHSSFFPLNFKTLTFSNVGLQLSNFFSSCLFKTRKFVSVFLLSVAGFLYNKTLLSIFKKIQALLSVYQYF
ncbi:hypothetical protein AYI68_g1622 [Smittium mucronatum]|uniref:Uncharacterized protein n=1 Tax=Smittium mucronatum TaxID=133383 RepID=A0A1R0H4X3_9FUNG|nr:hypothetical protein AYI68_g1622 [Smittium mucronatum]